MLRRIKPIQFDDGSTLEWASRESLTYRSGPYQAELWVDFGPCSFRPSRVFKLWALENWEKHPAGSSKEVPEELKEQLVSKIQAFYPEKRIVVKREPET